MRTFASLVCVIVLFAAGHAWAKRIQVKPGDSIQAAVDQAQPGDVVAVDPGVYHEAGTPCPTNPLDLCAVVVSKDDIRLVGMRSVGRPGDDDQGHGSGHDDGDSQGDNDGHAGERSKSNGHHGPDHAVLEAVAGQAMGIVFARPGADGATCLDDSSQRIHGARVRSFEVTGFEDDGVFMLCVEDWLMRDIAAHDNGEYGLFPSHTRNGRISHSVATGSHDTGVYIGQSFDARVDHSTASGNVSGFEIENSARIRLDHNRAHDNTGGILTFANPGLDVKLNEDNRVDHNSVRNNNAPNTCIDPNDEVCAVPSGTGILMLATDRNRVDHNFVKDNDSYGIGTISQCAIDPSTCTTLDVEPFPDGNRVRHNVVQGNGSNPDPGVAPFFAVDLAWDATGTDNCWLDNVADTQFPDPLPTCADDEQQ